MPISDTMRIEIETICREFIEIGHLVSQQDARFVLAGPVAPLLAEGFQGYLKRNKVPLAKALQCSTSKFDGALCPNLGQEKARASLKFYEDNAGDLSTYLLGLWTEAPNLNTPPSTKALLGFLPDIHLVFVGGVFVCTSDSVFAGNRTPMSLFGLQPLSDVGQPVLGGWFHYFSEQMGSRLGDVVTPIAKLCRKSKIESKLRQMSKHRISVPSDLRVAACYRKDLTEVLVEHYPTIPEDQHPMLVWVASKASISRLMLDSFFPKNSTIAFRMRALDAYHGSQAIRRLGLGSFLGPETFWDDTRKQSQTAKLRNMIGHYGFSVEAPRSSATYFDVVSTAAGMSIGALNALIDDRLEKIASIGRPLDALMAKGWCISWDGLSPDRS